MNIHKLINDTLSAEKYTDAYKAGWLRIFQHAKTIARSRGLDHKCDIIIKSIVDDLVFEHEIYIHHCDPSDDATCGDKSCMQALREQQHEFINEIRDQYITALRNARNTKFSLKQRKEFLNISRRLKKLWHEENNTNISSVPYEIYEEMPDSVVPEYVDDITETERYVNRSESRLDYLQEPECDPDDSHYIERDSKGKAIMFRRSYSYGKRRPRGNIGLLNGLYELEPEPTYRTPDQRRVLLNQLRSSNNEDDIRMLFAMTAPTRRDESDEQWTIKIAKRRKLRTNLIKRGEEAQQVEWDKYLKSLAKATN